MVCHERHKETEARTRDAAEHWFLRLPSGLGQSG